MEIDPDPEKQRCEGILGATGTAGAEAGAKVTSMVNQLTSLLLAKSVVGETHEIDTNNIKVRHSLATLARKSTVSIYSESSILLRPFTTKNKISPSHTA